MFWKLKKLCSVQIDGKRRVHFNAFMQDVHARIHEVKKHVVRDHSSTKPQPFDPIRPVARSISNQSWLICFDEFQVSRLTVLCLISFVKYYS